MNKTKRGGVRRGAGRPRQVFPSTLYAFRFRPEVVERLDALALWWGVNRTQAIEMLVTDDFLRRASSQDS